MIWAGLFVVGIIIVAKRLHTDTQNFNTWFWLAQLPWWRWKDNPDEHGSYWKE